MKRKFAINLEINDYAHALNNRTSVSFQTLLKELKLLELIKDQSCLINSKFRAQATVVVLQ